MIRHSPTPCPCVRVSVPVDPATWTAYCPECARPFQAYLGQQTLYITEHKVYRSKAVTRPRVSHPFGSPVIKCGDCVLSISDLISALTRSQWMMIRNHACHPGFVLQMRLATLIDLIAEGMICYAVNEGGEPYTV